MADDHIEVSNKWIDDYRRSDDVSGWVNDGAFDFVKLINRALHSGSRPVPGGVLEIGVHHGKFFVALNATVDPTAAKSIAVDLFEEQYLNIDYSGRGDREIFTQNLKQFDRHRGSNVIIEAADSTTLEPARLIHKAAERFKIVSVDGGHTAEHTISDIRIAASVVNRFGFVIVDDILNSHWLGVIDGVTMYLRGRPTLWPLAVGYNKLVMCPMSMHGTYKKFFTENFEFTKSTYLCGYEILSV
ncbi:MAG: class I SAM-dependent methyltransferase [Pseudomonadota bacterium]